MTDDIRRVTVRIGGTSYQLVSAEDEQYTRRIAARADEMIRRVMQNNPHLSQSMATVLALVNTIDDLSHVYSKLEKIEHSHKDNEKQTDETRQELKRMRELNWEMKKELLELRERCRAIDSAQAAAQQPSAQQLPEVQTDADPVAEAEPVVETAAEPIAETDDQTKENLSEETLQDYNQQNYTQTNLDEYIKDSSWTARREPAKPENEQPDLPQPQPDQPRPEQHDD